MKLQAVPGDTTRPVMDRVKEALFSIIGSDIQAANFLDLFAGTGSVGIEALSRGAAFAQFVDLNRRACAVIRHNLDHTGLADRAAVIRRDAFQLLARPPARHFDFIYIAPPQYKDLWRLSLQALDQNAAWRDVNTQIIVQIDPREFDRALHFSHLRETDQRRYGSTLLVFYRFAASAADADESADAPEHA